MRVSRIILTTLFAVMAVSGTSTIAMAGDARTGISNAQPHGGLDHHHDRHSPEYRLRQGFALGYGVAGTNIGNPRYFEEPRTRTHGSTPPRLGPGGVYDRSTRSGQRHQGHGHSRYRGDHYDRGYRDGYRDGRRDSRQEQRHGLGPGR